MKLWPFSKRAPEVRQSTQPFTDAIVAAIQAQATGAELAQPNATAAVEAAAGFYSRALAAAVVRGAGVAGSALTPSVLALVARDLIRRGESIFLMEIEAGALVLRPAGSWDVRGGPRESSYWYRLDLFGPSGNETRFVAGRERASFPLCRGPVAAVDGDLSDPVGAAHRGRARQSRSDGNERSGLNPSDTSYRSHPKVTTKTKRKIRTRVYAPTCSLREGGPCWWATRAKARKTAVGCKPAPIAAWRGSVRIRPRAWRGCAAIPPIRYSPRAGCRRRCSTNRATAPRDAKATGKRSISACVLSCVSWLRSCKPSSTRRILALDLSELHAHDVAGRCTLVQGIYRGGCASRRRGARDGHHADPRYRTFGVRGWWRLIQASIARAARGSIPAPGESICIACRIAARRRRANGERGKAAVEREFQLIFIAKHSNYATAAQPTEADLERGRTRRRIEDIEDERRARRECGAYS